MEGTAVPTPLSNLGGTEDNVRVFLPLRKQIAFPTRIPSHAVPFEHFTFLTAVLQEAQKSKTSL